MAHHVVDTHRATPASPQPAVDPPLVAEDLARHQAAMLSRCWFIRHNWKRGRDYAKECVNDLLHAVPVARSTSLQRMLLPSIAIMKRSLSNFADIASFALHKARRSQSASERTDIASEDEASRQKIKRIERLYRDHWKDLCARLRRVHGNGPPEPEDLAQVAFAKLIEQVDLATIDNPGAFLFRIAINTGRDRLRHMNQTTRLIRDELPCLEGDGLDQNTPSNVYESRERLSVTAAAIQMLSPKQREILVRSRIKDETFDQISDATGWSKADISRTLKSALLALQAAMRAYDD